MAHGNQLRRFLRRHNSRSGRCAENISLFHSSCFNRMVYCLVYGDFPCCHGGSVCIGYRAHDFVPVWGGRRNHCLSVQVRRMAEMPFEYHYYLQPVCQSGQQTVPRQSLCWFVQKEKHIQIEERGLPDYLELKEECMMLF